MKATFPDVIPHPITRHRDRKDPVVSLLLLSETCVNSTSFYNTPQRQEGSSCNNVAPVTNLCLGRATTLSHSSQWSKKKVAVET